MEKQVFIARETQLERLNDRLTQALSGQGGVCLISGEAGSGKTTLVNEFTHRAQENNKQLAIAVGICDAQTGIGDAYLPFREVLGQLTGDVEGRITQGTISKENASRLQNILVMTGQAIVDVGPDLIGVFVPGIGLATKLGAFVAEKTGWLNKLENLVNKPKAKLGESGLQESHIFEQYANVLCRISEKNPLLIFLDDLHWADTASINLLFHLGRRIGEHKILILGTYRSAETVIGRGGERHPLEKVLAEFKRYFGNISIDLDEAVEVEGRQFVEGYLESEPNSLSSSFVGNLYHHTDGHPLFTVELLRNLQERGDLIRDDEGRWTESESLDWKALPTKVEGVIEERIGRLQEELKEVLVIGSVQGEDFTAEVVARVQQAEDRGLIRKLSSELERQHRLVHTERVTRLEPGGQRLSFFRFQHNLFRTYLYNGLSEAEKAYLHEDVGNALEALYGDQADEIAVDLALHFEKAGVEDKTRYYLQKAGEQSAASYANEEAIEYFTRAMDLTPEHEIEKRYGLLLIREKVFSLKGFREKQAEDLAQLFSMAEKLNDDFKQGEVTLQKATFEHDTGNFQSAIESAKRVIQLAELIQNEEFLARGQFMWGVSAHVMGNYAAAEEHMLQALKTAQAANLAKIEASSLRGLGMIADRQGHFEKAVEYYQESREKCVRIGDSSGANKTNNNLGLVLCSLGDFNKAKDYYQEALSFFRKIGNRYAEGVILLNLGAASANQGDLQGALTYFEESLKIHRFTGNLESEATTLCNLGELSGEIGDFERSKDYMEKALQINRKIGSKYGELVNLHSLAILHHSIYEYSIAYEMIKSALNLACELEVKNWEALVLIVYGNLLLTIGDYSSAEGNFHSAYQIIEEINYQQHAPDVWEQQGLLNYYLGNFEKSSRCYHKAIELAKAVENQKMEAGAYLNLGNTLISQGLLDEAREAIAQHIALSQCMEHESEMIEPKTYLALVAWKEGKLDEALDYVKDILDYLNGKTAKVFDFSPEILLTCYKILHANQDPQAEDVIGKAYSLLMESAEKITDEAMRKSYLENVAVNCEIQEEFATLE